MKRLLSLTLSGLLGAMACDFGASDFEIVPSDKYKGMGGDSGDGDGDRGGDGDGDGDRTGDGDGSVGDGDGDGTGGTDAGDGDGGTGDGDGDTGDGDGTGGSDPGPTHECNPLGSPRVMLDSDALPMGANWDSYEGPLLAPLDQGHAVSVMEFEVEPGVIVVPPEPSSRVVMIQMLSDRTEIVDHTMQFNSMYLGTRNPSSVTIYKGELRFLLNADLGIVEVTIPIDDNQNFGIPLERWIATPCDGVAPDMMRLREVHAVFDDETFFAFTCNNDMNEVISYFGTEGNFQPLGPKTMDPNGLIQQYLKLGPLHFLRVGEDLGKVGYRVGQTHMQLTMVHPLSFDDDRMTSTNVAALRDGSGLFFYGGAVTGPMNPMDPPPLVPAEFYAGSVPVDEIPALSDSVPPRQLVSSGEVLNLPDIVLFDAITPIADLMYVGGPTFAPPDSVKVSLLNLDGSFALRDYQVYQNPDADMGSVALSPLGVGVLVSFVEGNQLKGRSIICGEVN